MVLFTKVEIKVSKPKLKEDEDDMLDFHQRNVLRDLLNGDDDDEESLETDIDAENLVVDAVLDVDNGVLFYEYEGVTNVEKLDERPITLSHGIQVIIDAYKAQGTPLTISKPEN